MARARCTFRQRDLTAAVKATLAAGLEIARVEVDQNGRIVVVTGKSALITGANDHPTNEWDVLLP